MKFFSASSKGLSHLCNEDSFAAKDCFAIIADGMGGESAGEIASHLAVETFLAMMKRHNFKKMSEPEIVQCLEDFVVDCDHVITSYSQHHPESIGMGTTVVIAIVVGSVLYTCWCGDSRCFVYNLSSGDITFSTSDHSYVQELINSQQITIEESFVHPDNNLITRYVGGGDEYALPETAVVQLHDNDIIVLCSDGLTGYCMPLDIARTIQLAGNSPKEICRQLSLLALSRKSDDDITIITSNAFSTSKKSIFSFNI